MLSAINDKDFNEFFEAVLRREGGYVNSVYDKGGETKYGISKKSYPNIDVKGLTIDGAKEIYFRDFWDKKPFLSINAKNVKLKIADIAVNTGLKNAVIILQRALRAFGFKLDDDGVLGGATLSATNSCNPVELIRVIRAEQAAYYRRIVAVNPTQRIFLTGWLNRAYDTDF